LQIRLIIGDARRVVLLREHGRRSNHEKKHEFSHGIGHRITLGLNAATKPD
jgi:hypothetical protein